MKLKIMGFAIALLSVATIGLVQLQSDAKVGGVSGSTRCNATAIGARGSAFTIKGNEAYVKFKVTGKPGCKVQLSANSFYAPSMSGHPYSKQVLYDRVTKTYPRGTYYVHVSLPSKSTQAKGCYYQVDLTYGVHNHQPVIAYGHGKLNCNVTPPPKPAAECKALSVDQLSRNSYRFNGTASATNGAKVSQYVFNTYDSNGKLVKSLPVNSSAMSASATISDLNPGTYKTQLVVKTSLGNKTSASCEKSFTVKPEEKPGVSIEKTVDGMKYEKVALNSEFDYELKVTNTGNVDLTDVKVTDTPEDGIALVSAEKGEITNNTFNYTIPSLKTGETQYFTLKAVVKKYKAGELKNTACVDAPKVPGNPDDCDHANVEVPKDVEVCNPKTGKILTGISKEDAKKYAPVNSPKCKEKPATPTKTETPEALPETGIADTLMKLVGAASLTGATAYYVASRRNS